MKIECFDEKGGLVESKATHISNECHERLPNLEHEHQLKLKDKELENKLSGDMMNTLISEAMKNPEIKKTV